MKDDGRRQYFESGAMRQPAEDKSRPDLIPPLVLLRIGGWFGKSAKKYAPHDWKKGIPSYRHRASMMRHVLQYMAGAKDEDHLSAIVSNVMMIMWNESERPDLDEMKEGEKHETNKNTSS